MSLRDPRPGSQAQVAALSLAGDRFDPLLREFLDEFYLGSATSRQDALLAEPALLAPIKDAYLAAVAEHLALRFDLHVPAWTDGSGRCLTEPFFAGGMEGMKALLLAESPLAFRRRLIFVSADALSRPRDPEFATLQPV